MSYNPSDSTNYINIKLTDSGRRALSLGALRFKKAVVSDREINYSIDRTNTYDILSNRILGPKDDHPSLIENIDGSQFVQLTSQNVQSIKQFHTAQTSSTGFFTGSTNAFAFDLNNILAQLNTTATPTGTNQLTLASGTAPADGSLIYVMWRPTQNGTAFSTNLISSGNPLNCLWYRIISASSLTLTLDRPVPSGAIQSSKVLSYPYNGIETYWGSGVTQQPRMWNMNIVRTYDIAGTALVSNNISGYTTYGSIEFNGTKQYLGFSSDTLGIGVIHYTNEYTGSTYAEQLIEKSVVVDLPTIMWHNVGGDNGQTVSWGVKMYDVDGLTITDPIANTTYRYLKDGTSSYNKIVGRVYHKLKIIVITDQELLTAMSYKSNRSYTLPELQLSFSTSPKSPMTNAQATGLCRTGYTYFVSYIAESLTANTSSTSYGQQQALHCGYITTIVGQADASGNPQYLRATFPPNAFPYMRSSTNMQTGAGGLSGTGWVASSIQLLVNEQPSTYGYGAGNAPMSGWTRMSAAPGGNGILSASTALDPNTVNGYTFIVSREDYNSGTTYNLNSRTIGDQSVLNFGDEAFFFGNISAGIFSTTYKSLITIFATNNQYNSSINETYDGTVDEQTYISEIGILDDNNNLVAVGKPTFPVKKQAQRYLAFQLEIDF